MSEFVPRHPVLKWVIGIGVLAVAALIIWAKEVSISLGITLSKPMATPLLVNRIGSKVLVRFCCMNCSKASNAVNGVATGEDAKATGMAGGITGITGIKGTKGVTTVGGIKLAMLNCNEFGLPPKLIFQPAGMLTAANAPLLLVKFIKV